MKARFLVPTLFSVLATSAMASQQDLDKYTTKDFVLGSEFLGCQPKGMKANHAGTLMYVAEMCGKKDENGIREATVSVIDLAKLKLKGTIRTPEGSRPYTITKRDGTVLKQPGDLGNTEVEMSVDGQYAMAVRCEGPVVGQVPGQLGIHYPGSGMVTVIDDKTGNRVKYIPTNAQGSKIITARPILANDPRRTQIVYVVNYFSDDISVLDITDVKNDGNLDGKEFLKKKFSVKSSFFNGKIEPRGLVFTKDGKYAFALSAGAGSIFVIDAVNHKKLAELSPISDTRFGRPLNMRHIVLTKDGKMAYLSHMRGDGISRIDMDKLLTLALQAAAQNPAKATLPESTWDKILVPFKNGKTFLALPHYPRDYPTKFPADAAFNKLFPNGFPILPDHDWRLTRPNTIVLDPVKNRYLYVSHRTDTSDDYNYYSPLTKGKVDVIDTWTGEVIISLVGGSQPTALEVTPDNRVLMTAGFKDHENNKVTTPALTFIDIARIIKTYEQ